MRQILFILTVLLGVSISDNFCPDFIICETSDKSNNCPPGTFYREKAKIYGCCPGCIRLKDENESCKLPTDCQPGLTCEKMICKRDPSQACEYYKRSDKVWKETKYWNPVCSSNGKFAPKQCKGEKISGTCFCVDEMGNRIFGEEEWSKAENMTCACSRLLNNLKKQKSLVTFHCTDSGDFAALQCHQEICWCAALGTGIPYTSVVPLEMMVSLPCYNKNKDGNQYFRKCDSANFIQESAKRLLSNHGTKEITLTSFKCNFDGSYHRVQLLREKKRCVYKNNIPLTEAIKSDTTTCNCAFDKHTAELQNKEFISDCQPNGNYNKIQIWNEKMYCVDDDGFPYSSDPKDCLPYKIFFNETTFDTGGHHYYFMLFTVL